MCIEVSVDRDICLNVDGGKLFNMKLEKSKQRQFKSSERKHSPNQWVEHFPLGITAKTFQSRTHPPSHC